MDEGSKAMPASMSPQKSSRKHKEEEDDDFIFESRTSLTNQRDSYAA